MRQWISCAQQKCCSTHHPHNYPHQLLQGTLYWKQQSCWMKHSQKERYRKGNTDDFPITMTSFYKHCHPSHMTLEPTLLKKTTWHYLLPQMHNVASLFLIEQRAGVNSWKYYVYYADFIKQPRNLFIIVVVTEWSRMDSSVMPMKIYMWKCCYGSVCLFLSN